MVRKDRKLKTGGGVMILVKRGIEFEESVVGNYGTSNDHAQINVVLEDSTKVQIASVYCPPNKLLNKSLFKNIVKRNKNSIILGDLNAHSLLNGSDRTDTRGEQLAELIQELHLVWTASRWTRSWWR